MKSEDVQKFHAAAAPHSSLSSFRSLPGLPDMVQSAHLMALLTEEYTEITAGLVVDEDLPNAAKEFLDLIYVAAGGLLAMGFRPAEIDEMWEAVHQSNMAKVDPERGLLSDNGGRPYLDTAGKIAKPPGYRAPNLAEMIKRYTESRPKPELVV